jgi:hypothetical protein
VSHKRLEREVDHSYLELERREVDVQQLSNRSAQMQHLQHNTYSVELRPPENGSR